VRVDKKWYLEKFTLNFYLDIQNAYGYKAKLAPIMLVETDSNGAPIVDPANPGHYKAKFIENSNGLVQPTLGIIVEFANKKKTKQFPNK
jgi:hypothetical protein